MSEEFFRAYSFAVTALPELPQRVRSPISKKGRLGEDAVDGGICKAVSLCGVRVEIFAAVVACEFCDAAGGVFEPDDAEVYGATGSAWRGCGEVEHASSRDAAVGALRVVGRMKVTAEILRFAQDDSAFLEHASVFLNTASFYVNTPQFF